jgi:diguanylate cyclase (GGDEF)-like protein
MPIHFQAHGMPREERERLQMSLVEHLFERMRWVHLLTLIPMVMLTLVLADLVPRAWVTAWAISLLAVEAALAVLCELKHHHTLELKSQSWWLFYSALHVVASVLWMLAGVAFFQSIEPWPATVIIITILAVVMGGLSALSWDWRLYAAGNLVLLLPIAVWHVMQYDNVILFSLGVSSLVMLPIVTFISWRENRERADFIRAELDKNRLLSDLDIRSAELSQIRSKYSSLRDTDSLTGFSTLTKWKDNVAMAMRSVSQRHGRIAVLVVDLRRFTKINQRWGKGVGDQVLRLMAQRLEELFGHGRVSRQSADEFVVMLAIRDSESAREAATRIYKYLSVPLMVGEAEVNMEPAVGIAIYPEHGMDVEALVECANLANHHVKSNASGFSAFYQPVLAETTRRRIDLEIALAKAIQRNELYLVYQPQVSISDGRIIGAEALLRWNSATMGAVSPMEFIPVAEQTGQILAIGQWIIREVCRDLRRWQTMAGSDFHVAVNVSPLQLRSDSLGRDLLSVLGQEKLPPQALHVEITESAIMENPIDAMRVVAEIRKAGIRVALDDFGTGYSSLGYLKNIEIDYLKLDQSFIRTINVNAKDRAIAQSIISLAKALGLQVVGEGIETMDVWETLRDHGCDYGQGWFFGRPVLRAEMERIIVGRGRSNPDRIGDRGPASSIVGIFDRNPDRK